MTKLNLELGGTYVTRGRETVMITGMTAEGTYSHDEGYIFFGDNAKSYTRDGCYDVDNLDNLNNLVAQVESDDQIRERMVREVMAFHVSRNIAAYWIDLLFNYDPDGVRIIKVDVVDEGNGRYLIHYLDRLDYILTFKIKMG